MIHSTQCSERINAERIRYKVKRKLVDNEGPSPAICCSFVQLQPRVTCDRVVKHACQRSISRVGFIAPGYLSHRGAFYLFFFFHLSCPYCSRRYTRVSLIETTYAIGSTFPFSLERCDVSRSNFPFLFVSPTKCIVSYGSSLKRYDTFPTADVANRRL